jgi:hypothetical protein
VSSPVIAHHSSASTPPTSAAHPFSLSAVGMDEAQPNRRRRPPEVAVGCSPIPTSLGGRWRRLERSVRAWWSRILLRCWSAPRPDDLLSRRHLPGRTRHPVRRQSRLHGREPLQKTHQPGTTRRRHRRPRPRHHPEDGCASPRSTNSHCTIHPHLAHLCGQGGSRGAPYRAPTRRRPSPQTAVPPRFA